MTKRMNAIVSIVALIAFVLVAIPAAVVLAADPPPPPPTVDGLFYGDPDDDGDADVDVYLHLLEEAGRGNLYYYPGDTTYGVMVVLPSVNDNVFGISKKNAPNNTDRAYVESAGWNQEHTAAKLIGSDNFQFQMVCADGTTYQWQQDLAYWDGTEYASGVGGTDGLPISCSGASCVADNADLNLVTASSTAWNFNSSAWDYTLGGTRSLPAAWKSVDTPPTPPDPQGPPYGNDDVADEDGWGPDLTDPSNVWWNSTFDWEWTINYEFSLNAQAACGEQSIDLRVVTAHNSPPKEGDPNVYPKYYDYGDLPDYYPTLFADNGARHLLVDGGPTLGSLVDADGDGQPDPGALGDDFEVPSLPPNDEEGVAPVAVGSQVIPGELFNLNITFNSVGAGGAYLDVWFDWNADGILDDATEHTQIFVSAADNGVTKQYGFLAPVTTQPGADIYARFRLSTAGITTATGAAADGEVEDYLYKSAPLAAGMGPITARAFVDSVLVKWESLSELDIIGYDVERAPSPDGPWTKVNALLIQSQKMGMPIGDSYEVVDPDVEAGAVYYYRLVSLDSASGSSVYEPIRVVVPTIGEPYAPYVPPTPASIHRVFIPMVFR